MSSFTIMANDRSSVKKIYQGWQPLTVLSTTFYAVAPARFKRRHHSQRVLILSYHIVIKIILRLYR
jgi:hypothetical protein